jgi:hypothetical protein
MSWLFSQVLVEEYLGDTSLDGAPCALWNGMPTQRASWLPDKMTDACLLSRSGMTFKPLTDDLGGGVLMSYLEAFPVRTFHAPGKVQESKAIEVPCGSTWRESSAKFNLATLSWKTHQCLWEEDLPSFSLTLPKWGMMQGGVLWERTTSPLPTSGIESGSWLTPTCMNIEPTENRREKRAKFRASIGRKDAPGGLAEQVATPKFWPTPTCHNAKECDAPAEANRNTPTLCHLARGGDETQPKHLNPPWVEWLMGWPLGWTDLKPLETDKFQQWLNSHGKH